jgi:hypothetical protein
MMIAPQTSLWVRIRETLSVRRITEALATTSTTIVRRVQIFTRRFSTAYATPTTDYGRPDYDFWRRTFYGQVAGLELAGLMIKPLVSKVAAWALGRPPIWKCEDAISQQELVEWWTEHHPQVLQAYRSSLKQGDSFVVVNADLSLTVVDPRNVDPIVDPFDYSNIIGWRITQVLAHPETTDRMTMQDEYYADRRVHSVSIQGRTPQVTVFPNLIGRLTVVHIPNQLGEGEIFGHPEAEGTIRLLQRYGEVFDAAIEGNVMQGRPTPVISFDAATDLNKFWEMYGEKRTRMLPDGTLETTPALDFDLSQVLTITNGTFDYKSPGNFTQDVVALLELMFYLFLEYSEIPEFVMGNAIASSKASTETQMPVFEKFIEGKQGETRQWLVELASIALGFLSLVEPGVVDEAPTLSWPKISQDGRLTLATVEWAYSVGLLDDRTAIQLAPVDVANIEDVLARAKQQFDERQAQLAAQQAAANPQNSPPSTFAGRQNSTSKQKINPISANAEVADNEDRVQSRVKN